MHGFNQANRYTNRWHPTQLARLAELNAEGLSRAVIATRLNQEFDTCFSRNAVIGACNRAGLTTPARDTLTPEQRLARAKKSRGVGRGNWQRVKRGLTAEGRRLAPAVDDMAIPLAQREILAGLNSSNCHWPVGDPCTPDFFFCGGVAEEDRPYCAAHCKVAYIKPERGVYVGKAA